MTEDQFTAWLLFALPIIIVFGNGSVTFEQRIINALIYSILPIGLFLLAENEFIKDCKKGYKVFEDSIFPLYCYRRYISD